MPTSTMAPMRAGALGDFLLTVPMLLAWRALRPRPQILHLHRAGGGRLRRAADDLDQAHAAVAGDRQALVIAEARNLDPRLLGRLDQGQGGVALDLDAVDDDLAKVGHFVTELPGTAASIPSGLL